MIDVIIPIYNVNIEQLEKCLLSVVAQTIAKELEITIIDDGSSIIDKKLDILLEKIKIFIPVQLLRYQENRGPGYARQYGIDHTYNDYIMFIDADDMFTPVAAEVLSNGLKFYPEAAMIMGEFYELYSSSTKIKRISFQLTWIFSKMYRRSIINKYNFKFNIEKDCSYGNEDVGFNVQYQYLLDDKDIITIDQPLYYWSDCNKNSITRNNNHEYNYTTGHKGYVMNFVRTYQRLKSQATRNQSKEYAFKHLVDICIDYYKNWDVIKNDDNLINDLLKYDRVYYKEVFKEFDNIEDTFILKEYWKNYSDNNLKNNGFNHFLNYLNYLR